MKAFNLATPVLASGLILATFVGIGSNILRTPSVILEEEPTQQQVVHRQSTDVAVRGIAYVIRSGAGVVSSSIASELKRAASNKG